MKPPAPARWPASAASLAALLLVLLAVLLASLGCAPGPPANTDWAAPAAGDTQTQGADAVQKTLSAYGQALVDKDRGRFAALLDPAHPDFVKQQLDLFDRLKDVPFSRFQVTAGSESAAGPGAVTAKVSIAYTFAGSFGGLPQPVRAAYSLVQGADGWLLTGDATGQALGKARDAVLWDFGPVAVMSGRHLLVLYHPGNEATARQLVREADEAYPRLEQVVPGVSLPLIPVQVFDNKQQIDQAYPGKWQEWTGGAARMLGPAPDQGGEIIVDAALYQQSNTGNPGYNGRMIGHEMTHVALFSRQGSRTPPFLVEGLADFVGGQENHTLIKQKVEAGRSFSPTLSDLCQPSGFTVLLSTDAADLAYEEADTAVNYLEQRYGNQKVLALLDAFKQKSAEGGDQAQLVDGVFREVLGIGWADFEQGWKQLVLSGSG